MPDGETACAPDWLDLPIVDFHIHEMLLGGADLAGVAAAVDLGGPDGPRRPDRVYAGRFLTVPGGYPSDRAWAAPGSWREVRSAADGAEAVAEQMASGSAVIKVALNAAAGPVPGPAVLTAIVAAAHAAGREVVAHCEGGTVGTAADAGVDVLAHTPFDEALDTALAQAFPYVISTLDIHGWGTRTAESAAAISNLRVLAEAGAQVLYGTDLGNGPLPPGVNRRELDLLAEAGLGRDDIRRAVSATAAPPGLRAALEALPVFRDPQEAR
ncbi:hypothetical protein TTY48_25400 [Tsukamurella sp. TY48]|uniref:hypothetical protein n=1 Tax=Tsukamurella TaxID=2060 RepID=UPI001C7DE7C6|nr:hypothetical protein [Tsukamurella sp. TY48]GIZ97928.1 hypothetical protein TTY48_25400 [Tsukamurella sp. TY48]